MLRVYYSNQTETLVEALVERIGEHRPSLYDNVDIVVPNRNLATYLELTIARMTGICANVRFRFPRELFEAAGDGGLRGTALRDRVLTALFNDGLLAEPDLEPIRTYLHAGGDREDGVSLRRVQLAGELSGLFAEYAESRPELLACWRAGLFMESDDLRAVESWQRRFWLDVVAPAEPVAESSAPIEGGVVHIFGISYLQRAHLDALGRIARKVDVYFYTLNPCQEIWEALTAPVPLSRATHRYERRGRDLGPGEVFSIGDPFRLVNPGEMLPLRRWARPGRESLRLLNALTGCELSPRIREPKGRGLLHQLQRDTALRKPQRSSIPKELDFEGDDTIVVMECADVRRELEAIAAEIWRLVELSASEDSEPLRFNDIAVVLAPPVAERYQALIGSVFSEMHGIPHNRVDLPLRAESRLAEACELLLDVPKGRFTRQEVLRFVTHPAVMASFPWASGADWIGWCDALGIVGGADRRDHEGTHEEDVFNWDQGLKRLALGCFMAGERSGDDRLFVEGDDTTLPEETPPGRMRSAGSFGLVVRSLLADAREASRVQMTLPAWMDFMSGFVASYLEPRSPEDERVFRKCLNAIDQLGAMTLGGVKVPYSVPRELVLSALAGLYGSRGQYLVDGVVVSSFLPMRAIPFKVIFAAGLGEEHFPARDRASSLDLRRAQRRAGDVSAREQDKYLFLETLLSARERFYMSYVARDELTGERRQPSSLVLELEQTLQRGYVARMARRRYPVRRDADDVTCAASPSAARERRARLLGAHLRAHLNTRTLPGLDALELPAFVRDVLGCVRPPARHSGPAIHTVSVAALRGFLESPLQGSARFVLRLVEEEEEDWPFLDDEAFPTTAVDRTRLLREALRRGGEAAAYDETVHRFELRGDRPAGGFGEGERRRHLEVLGAWRIALRELAGGKGEPRLETPEPRALLLDDTRVELGRADWSYLDAPRMAVSLCSQTRSRFHPERESLRGFLDHVFRSAAGLDAGTSYRFVTINAPPEDETRRVFFTFAPISVERARRYLKDLIEDLREGGHDYRLPCESVFKDSGKAPGLPLHRTSTHFGPVRHPEDYDPPDEEIARSIVARRFGLYFESRAGSV